MGDGDRQSGSVLAGATGAWDWDLSAGVVRGDSRFADLCGFTREAAADGVTAEDFFARVHPEDQMRLRIAVAGVAHGAEIFNRDFRLVLEDGVRWLSARGRSEQNPERRPTRFSGVLVDVTEQKRIEARLRIAQTAGGVGTFEYVEGFGTVSVSQQFCRLLGLHPTDALPVRTINARVHAGDPPLIGTDDASPLESVDTELRILRADTGEERWLAVRGERRRDLEDQAPHVIGVIYDITDTKRSQARLRDLARTLEERVEARTLERDRIWNSSRDLFAVIGEDGIFRAVNPAWEAMLGHAEDEIVGRSFFDVVKPEDIEPLNARWAARPEGAGLQDYDLRLLSREGDARVISWTVIPLEDAYYAIGRDITERRHLEDQLRQAQKMEAVGQLTGGLAHDFNNMLTGVLGGLDIIRRRLREGRVQEAEQFIDVAVASAQRAAALTHRLLAFARRQSLDPTAVDPDRLIGSMEDLLRRTLGERVDLAIALADDLWTTLADANQLESALLNLAINARDAMPEGGKLTIEACNVTAGPGLAAGAEGLEPGDYVQISVSDTGTGMPAHVVARVFDPFFTTKPLGQGTGLGLSMVYGFARQSGGHVAIYSEIGVGTTVRLYLPRHESRPDAEDGAARAGPAPAGAGETVLVVEDDASVRTIVTTVLTELGYAPLEVADSTEALKVLSSDRDIDLMISDVGLPGLNGRQLADMARERRPTLPVLFITGYAAEAARRSEFLGPGMEMISKPFAIDILAAKIREMIEP